MRSPSKEEFVPVAVLPVDVRGCISSLPGLVPMAQRYSCNGINYSDILENNHIGDTFPLNFSKVNIMLST